MVLRTGRQVLFRESLAQGSSFGSKAKATGGQLMIRHSLFTKICNTLGEARSSGLGHFLDAFAHKIRQHTMSCHVALLLKRPRAVWLQRAPF